MSTPKYDSVYTAHVDNELWPKIRQLTIEIGLHHLFVPYENHNKKWYFKVGGTIGQTNEFSRRWAELEPKEEMPKKLSFFGKIKQLFGSAEVMRLKGKV